MSGLIDTTLREGAQTPGVLFSRAQRIAIGKAVAAVGIEEIEVGTASARDGDLGPLLAELRKMEHCPRLALWCRCRPEDIRHAASLRPDVLSLSLPASQRHIRVRLGRDQAWVLNRLRESVHQARALGIGDLSLGVEDASRAEDGFVTDLIGTAVESGVARIRLADTVGVLTPAATAAMIARQRQLHPGVAFAMHAHNDFGMATANAVAALEAGAQWADVTVLGLGERAGCARLEEVAGLLTLVQNAKAYRLAELPALCALVAEAAGRTIPANHPLVGGAVFACESGLHVHGLLADPAVYEPFPPERVNGRRMILLGAKSGRRAVAGYLARLGVAVRPEALPGLVSHVRRLAIRLGRPLREAEIRSLIL